MVRKKHKSRGFAAKATIQATQSKPLPPPPQTSSWRLFVTSIKLLRHYGTPIVVMVVLPGLVSQFGTVIANVNVPNDPSALLGNTVRFLAAVWAFAGFAAVYYYVLRVMGGKPSGILESYRHGFRYLWRLALASMAAGTIVLIGLLLLIVPGLVWLRRYFMTPYFVIDENLTVRDALVASSKASKPVKRHMWTMLLILTLNLAALLLLSSTISVYGIVLSSFLGMTYVFLPALRYQEMTSNVRAGALAFEAVRLKQEAMLAKAMSPDSSKDT